MAEPLIGAQELEVASHGHCDRMALHGPRPIHRILASLHVDSEEFQAMAQMLRDLRDPPDSESYSGGLLDGFVIGVRAARESKGGEKR